MGKAEKLSEKQIAERVAEGEIRAIITFELVGRPKAHIEKALQVYLEKLQKDSRLTFIEQDVAEAMEQDDGMFSTFAEVEMLIKGLTTLNWIAINFSPASMEIIEPTKFSFGANDLTGWMNDFISKLHELGTEYRDNKHKRIAMNESLNAIIVNFILSLTEDNALDLKQLQEKMGIHKDQLKDFVEHLEKKGRLEKFGKGWRAAKK